MVYIILCQKKKDGNQIPVEKNPQILGNRNDWNYLRFQAQ